MSEKKIIPAGEYKVEITLIIEEDVLESQLDEMFQDAMYSAGEDGPVISSSDIGQYMPVN